MILTHEDIKNQDGNCLEHICFYTQMLQFMSQAIYIGCEDTERAVFSQYNHEMVIGMSEIIRDCSEQIKMICDAGLVHTNRQYNEIRFLKKQVNELAGGTVADELETGVPND